MIRWDRNASEAQKTIARKTLPDYKATGNLSLVDRTIRCKFVRPGQPEGDLEGTLFLTLTGEAEGADAVPPADDEAPPAAPATEEAAETAPTEEAAKPDVAATGPGDPEAETVAAPAPPPQAEDPRKDEEDTNAGFTRIFNGRDLQGWQYGPTRNRKWVVEKGELIGDGDNGNDALLATDRDDYADVHIKMKVLRGTNRGQVFVRWAWNGSGYFGYGVAIGVGRQQVSPGSICKAENWPLKLAKPLWMARSEITPSADKPWYELEIVAKGATIATYIDGEKAAEYTDEKASFARGNILLYARAGAQFRFKDIAVKRLAAPSRRSRGARKRSAPAAGVGGLPTPGSGRDREQDLGRPTTRGDMAARIARRDGEAFGAADASTTGRSGA